MNLESYWLPYTANRAFKKIASHHRVGRRGFTTGPRDGQSILDSFSGLWTSGLGHCHPKIVSAVQRQVARLDYSAAFQVSHGGAFELAERLTDFCSGRL